MWMGTYPSVPSYLLSTGETLEEHLKKNPELVGKKIVDQFGPGLPFLPKVWEVSTTMP
jgi:mannose-6-phosphate isomerase